MLDDKSPSESLKATPPWWFLITVFVFLLIWSFGRVPVPGVNEPHYLSKAKHYCNPDWCAGDLFLESSNPHLVFYATFGQLTRFLTLEQTAVVGRVLGLAVVAVGWQRLATAVTGQPFAGLLALPFFALLQSLGNWSGEWLVGGIEAKVVAYGFLFYAIGSWIDGKAIAAGIAAGLSISFHPLVGVWGAIAGLGATLFSRGLPWSGDGETSADRRNPRALSTVFLAAVLAIALAIPGLVPALNIIRGSSAEQATQADYLQLAGRLAHHLDPMVFPKESHRYFGMEIAFWLMLMVITPVNRRSTRWWRWLVISTLVIAAAGVLLAAGPRPIKQMPGWEWRISLLKFYPFRLADLIVPLAVSLSLSGWFLQVIERGAPVGDRQSGRTASLGFSIAPSLRIVQVLSLATLAGSLAVAVPGSDKNPSQMSQQKLADWIDALRWVRANTPKESLIYALDERWAARWYAQRPEYVNYKDCPQDPNHLLEWNRRLWVLARWNRQAYVFADAAFSREELADLRGQTGIDYLITTRRIRVLAPQIYGNDQFAVYSLKDAGASQ